LSSLEGLHGLPSDEYSSIIWEVSSIKGRDIYRSACKVVSTSTVDVLRSSANTFLPFNLGFKIVFLSRIANTKCGLDSNVTITILINPAETIEFMSIGFVTAF